MYPKCLNVGFVISKLISMAVPIEHILGKSYRVASPKFDNLSNNSKPIKKNQD